MKKREQSRVSSFRSCAFDARYTMSNIFQKVLNRINAAKDPPVKHFDPLERLRRRLAAENAWRHRLRKKPPSP
jgi:hypothetical protein